MSDQIAIVGIGCRFPGADNAEEFWKVLLNGENHVCEVGGNSRWNFNEVYDPDKNAEGKTYVNKAGLVKDIEGWDNHLFGVSDEEAIVVDPQQKVVLECCHMAMEDAGITRKRLDGSNTSVYIGAMNDDFKAISSLLTADNGYVVTGIFRSILSARVSYMYNLKGPCMVVDTACSSSLVAIHLGCQSLRLKESDMCIAGGVSVLLDPLTFIALSKARMLSPTGQCHAFTSKADGYARGEGCGIVILQRLDDAVAEGNTIWGVLNTGTNQDGRMITPITAPSGQQQLELLERVYMGRDEDKNAVQVIEAHGTGTSIGDPTEVDALGTFFKNTDTARDNKIKIGSLKTNIGHLESAAGVAGIIKVLLMMKNKTVVQSLMYSEENGNPKLDFKGYNLFVPTENINWPIGQDSTRHACVNSFGFGGSNAHIFVKQFKPTEPNNEYNGASNHLSPLKLFAFSSLLKKGLVQNLKSFVEDLDATTADITEMSMTSLCRRDHYKYRVAVSASSKEELKQRCNQRIQRIEGMVFQDRLRLVFVFSGVGTTWKGMCIELLRNQMFLSGVKLADEELQKHTGWSIIQKWKDNADVLDPLLGHLSIFLCQLGISAIWEKLGIHPDIVVGQSVGEVAACFTAGLIDLKTAVRLIYHRSLLLSQSPTGSMMVVRSANIPEIEEMCKEIGSINIAVYISPKSCTVSGNTKGILALEKQLKSKAGVRVKILDVTAGYHSHLVKEAGLDLEKIMTRNFKAGTKERRTPIISTVYGTVVKEEDIHRGSYWRSNITSPVLFHDAVFEARGKHENTVFIEIGPSPVLKAHISDIFGKDTDCTSIPSVEKGNEHSTLMLAIGMIYERGRNPDFTLLFDNLIEIKPSPIPRYIFNKKSFPVRNGAKPSTAALMERNVSLETTPYVFDHMVGNRVIIPGALYADVGFEAGKILLDLPCDKLSVQLDLLNTVPVQGESEVKLDVRVEKARSCHIAAYKFGIKWKNTLICKGEVREKKILETQPYIKKDQLVQNIQHTFTSSEIYGWLSEFGFRYGKRLKVLGDGASNADGGMCLIDVHIPEEIRHDILHSDIHPSLLDGMLQSTIVLARANMRQKGSSNATRQFLPIGMDSVTVTSYITEMLSGNFKVQIFTEQINSSEFETMEKYHFNVYLIDTYGLIFAQIENIVLYAGRGHLKCCDDLRLSMIWQKIPEEFWSRQSDPTPSGEILVVNANLDIRNAFLSIKEGDTVMKFTETDSNFDVTSQNLPQLVSDCSHVIVFIEPNLETDPLKVETIMDVVTNNLRLVQHLIMVLKSAPVQTTELTIVTHAVHASHYPDGYMRPTSLIGSEMWGFFRNIEVEFIYKKSTLIDIANCNQSTVRTLFALMSRLQKDNGQTGREYCIYNTTLMTIEVHASNKRHIAPSFRSNITVSQSHSSELVLCSSHPHFVDKPFFVYKENNTCQNSIEPSLIEMEVEEIYIHDSGIFPTTSSQNKGNIKFLSQKQIPNRNEMLAIEMLATKRNVRHVSKGIGKLFQKKAKVDNDTYVVCYPCIASRVVKVPTECCIKLSDIQRYKPGLVSAVVMLWKLLDEVPSRSEVYIFHSHPANHLRGLVHAILDTNSKKCLVAKSNETISRTPRPTALVLQNQGCTLDVLRKFKYVFSLPECLPNSIVKELQESGVTFSVLDTQRVFEKVAIRQTMMNIAAFLNGSSATDWMEAIQNHEKFLNLPLEIIRLDMKRDRSSTSYPSTVNATQKRLFDKMASYIVVGGLTGVGWFIVELLAEMGAGVLVTLGRRSVEGETKTLDEFKLLQERYTCTIRHIPADVTVSTDLKRCIQNVTKMFPKHPIKGIFQGAGVVESVPLQAMTKAHFQKVLRPKIQGTVNLHNETKHLQLDYFVLLSSISSIFGTQSHSNYGAANSFLDAFANFRRHQGLKCQSINWGAITTGMAAVPTVSRELEQRGHILLKKEEFRSCFVHSLLIDETNVVYAHLDQNIIHRIYSNREMGTAGNKLKFLWENDFLNDDHAAGADTKQFDRDSFLKAELEEQIEFVQSLLKECLAATMYGGSIEEIELTDSLVDLGIDSISSLSLSNIIRNYFGVEINAEIMFDPETTIKSISVEITTEARKVKRN